MQKLKLTQIWTTVFRRGDPLLLFIGLNVLVFAFLNLLGVLRAISILPHPFYEQTLGLFQLPADFGRLVFRPWTLLTYMFTQLGLFHLLFNLLWLYGLGRIFLDFHSTRQFVFVYLGGGLAGAVLFLFAYQWLPGFAENRAWQALIGASASVSAIVFAAATSVPNYRIRLFLLGDVPLKYLALVFLILDLLDLGGEQAGGRIAHLGGALFGFLTLKALKNGRDWSLIWPFKSGTQLWSEKRSKLRVASSNRGRFIAGSTPREREKENQARVDAVLDKISKSGYDGLSKEEKEVLFRASQRKDSKGDSHG